EYLRGVAENANLPQYMRDRLTEAAAALEAAREDGARLDWLARQSIPEGFVHVTSDIYEYACEVADENGRDEPNDADLLAGHRRMIDAARAIDQARGKGGQEVAGG